ncbi:MAG TPA: malto-oligosyltrehalose synthase [Pirellulales bacterium]|nr:malto-oligosyltrehalose synthase [Pirellulales bacterium]
MGSLAVPQAMERAALSAATPRYLPASTYRLQFSAHLRFADAAALAAYFEKLGIAAVYASPLFRARRDSAHGYDVIDPNIVDPEFGSETDFQQFAEELARHQLGLVMDVVPNHMGIDDPNNRWWQDVLENGPGSAYAKFFDIEWHPPKESLQETVLVPVLGDQYGKVLEAQELKLAYRDQRFYVEYYQRRFPLSPATWTVLLTHALATHLQAMPAENPARMELESIVTALEHLPSRTETDPEKQRERQREQDVARRRLATLMDDHAEIRAAIDATLETFNGRKGEPHSFDRLENILAQQSYRLCYWRVAADEINYRRFFDINELAALHVEDPDVFRAVHEMILRFVARGWVHGLRIDHPDGLYDPEQYLESLQDGCKQALVDAGGRLDAERPTYVVVEKILGYDEELPTTWRTAGTTGYDFLNQVGGIFVDRTSARAIKETYEQFTDVAPRFSEIYYYAKRTILAVSMSSELHMIARRLDRISEQHRFSRDFTLASLQRVVSEVIACFPVYRTYIRPSTKFVSDVDRARIREALRIARRRNPAINQSLFDFLGSILLLEDPDGITDEQRAERRQFVMRFQQLTGPVTAKGLEDTAFYRAYPLASLNEVGGEPQHFGTSVEEFHRRNQARLSAWPMAMLATSTHDTKRSEDVRARISVLSEMTDAWAERLDRWNALNRPQKTQIEGSEAPDTNEEYLFYQTLAGTWPLESATAELWSEYVDRIVAYMIKAAKEAKLNTSWMNPEQDYDAALEHFVRGTLERREDNRFLADFHEFAERLALPGMINSLSQTLLKIASPGVPDFYQGTEIWNFSLVDPDNRRPVDFALRDRLLTEVLQWYERDPQSLASDVLKNWRDGRIKLFVTTAALGLRRSHIELFIRGNYQPLAAEGAAAEHVCAFARSLDDEHVIAAAPRLVHKLHANQQQVSTVESWQPEVWSESRLLLPAGLPTRWRHRFTGEEFATEPQSDGASLPQGDGASLDLAELLARFPIALLESID